MVGSDYEDTHEKDPQSTEKAIWHNNITQTKHLNTCLLSTQKEPQTPFTGPLIIGHSHGLVPRSCTWASSLQASAVSWDTRTSTFQPPLSMNYGLPSIMSGFQSTNYGQLSFNYGFFSLNYELRSFNSGFFSLNYGLLWGIVVCCFARLGASRPFLRSFLRSSASFVLGLRTRMQDPYVYVVFRAPKICSRLMGSF